MTKVRDADDVCRPVALLGDPDGDALAPGQLGVLMARAGVGKSTCLVQLGLNHLVRGEPILHLALGDQLAEVEASYTVQLDARLPETDPMDRALLHGELSRQRLIVAHPEPRGVADHLDGALRVARDGLEMEPAAILVDGFDWEADEAGIRGELDALRQMATDAGAALWLTGTTHRHRTGAHPTEMPPACAPFADRIELGVYLEPLGAQIAVRILHDRRGEGGTADETLLDSRKLRPITGDEEAAPSLLEPRRHTLFSGGAPGAEAAFGACAEEWGLTEKTYSFAGREVARTRGLVELSEAQLRRGDVSRAYLTARMRRTYSDEPAFSMVLQSLWHQVTGAGEVFAVGAIQPDGTVRGGTGWAVELARHWGKPVAVFDQPQGAWRRWDGERWAELELEPTVTAKRFCGTGTRQLDEAGQRAIRELFQASFGTPRSRDDD